jgi:hypothetical protein
MSICSKMQSSGWEAVAGPDSADIRCILNFAGKIVAVVMLSHSVEYLVRGVALSKAISWSLDRRLIRSLSVDYECADAPSCYLALEFRMLCSEF